MTVGMSSSLVSAATDRKHRPRSHPLLRTDPPAYTEQEFYAHISRRIRLLRSARGWSQRDLALVLGVSSPTVCHWEMGKGRPTAWHIERIERSLGQVRP